MIHVAPATLVGTEIGHSEFDPISFDSLSRELARAAACGHESERLPAALRIISNVRDFLVAELSEAAEAHLDAAINALVRN